jgi:hypothetical protein
MGRSPHAAFDPLRDRIKRNRASRSQEPLWTHERWRISLELARPPVLDGFMNRRSSFREAFRSTAGRSRARPGIRNAHGGCPSRGVALFGRFGMRGAGVLLADFAQLELDVAREHVADAGQRQTLADILCDFHRDLPCKMRFCPPMSQTRGNTAGQGQNVTPAICGVTSWQGG